MYYKAIKQQKRQAKQLAGLAIIIPPTSTEGRAPTPVHAAAWREITGATRGNERAVLFQK
jgi:hypothetical protein